MRAVVLAAGRGSRMGPATADRPKCLMEIRGRTLLERQVAALREAGVVDTSVVAGWRAEAFAEIGLPVFRNDRWAETTMVESLAAAEPWLSRGTVLVVYGDIVFSPATVRRLRECHADLAIAYEPDWQALWSRRFADPLDDAETFVRDATGALVDIGDRPATTAEVQGQYMGLLRISPVGWAVMSRARDADPAVRGLDMTGLLRHLVRRRLLPVATVAVEGPWYEFDHPSDAETGLEVIGRLDAASRLPLPAHRRERIGSDALEEGRWSR
ncbi:phosphocholine cytidylyltransferase family protein [Streptomyces sp. NA02950]|uniref:phosphocholine cytidylyltransferase family protein n=1 Tax=Streptomyces sp. NA02950 TaxID=2742137 RepID=UPI001591785E|nr:phosphocholine cytidylyltransferase family protein [Streptomyces sp. NA02950]QKV97192.1 phosphocholine cytidylyltransferase family protein [Streptomyces sp. NA02950]